MVTEREKRTITIEEYRAILERINREAPSEAERRRLIGAMVKRNLELRDVGDFDSTGVLRLVRDGKIDY